MRISAVYIAKNEAKNITRSLDSIKESVDELILVDTGSTDETVEIFKSYGGQVFFQQWQDDFSAPRNLALSKATGDWIVLLDADESFFEETKQNLRTILENVSSETQGLLVMMINYDKDSGKALDEFYSLRVVRNIKGLNYKGRIHEMLYLGDKVLSKIQRVSADLLTIEHTGYSLVLSPEKCKRNLQMIKSAIAAGDPEERYYTYLFEIYSGLGDMKQAIHYGWMDVKRGRQSITYASRSYRGLMAYYAKDNTPAGQAKRLEVVEKAVKDFPELPDFHAEYSECLYQQGRYEKASQEMKKALELYDNYDGLEPCLLTGEMASLMKKRYQEIEIMVKQSNYNKISACVIVKNEEKNIGTWLENAKVYADEIIINDTGSTDSTKDIITGFSEENPDMSMVLLESQWQEDFSYAKNQCIAEATGEWIVFTDADEIFREPENIPAYLQEEAVKNKAQVIFVPMANVDVDDNRRVINIFSVPRIFHREAGLRYVGRIHESISIDGNDIASLCTVVADNGLYMEHTGYSASLNIQKAKRNLQLLLLDLAEGKNVQKNHSYLAECYYILGDYNKALDNALRATQSPYQPIGHKGDMYWLALNSMEKLDYPIDDRMTIVETGIALLPELPDFYVRKGMLQLEEKRYHAGLKSFILAEGKLTQYSKDNIHEQSSYMMSVLHEYYADWGRCLYKVGRSHEAEEKLKKALDINPWTEKAICYWADIYQGRKDKELLRFFSEIYDGINNSKEILSGIFAVNGFPELAEYYSNGEFDNWLRDKNYNNIYAKSMKEMAEILPPLCVCLLEHYQENLVKLLPENLQTLVRYFHELPHGENVISRDVYNSISEAVKNLGSEETIEKYIELGNHIK